MTVIEHTKDISSALKTEFNFQSGVRELTFEAELNWNLLFVGQSKPHWDQMLRFCMTLAKDKSHAEDLLQSALLKGLKAFPKFVSQYSKHVDCNRDVQHLFLNSEIQYHFKNWLYKIIKNLYLDDKDTRQRWELHLTEETLENVADKIHFQISQADSCLRGDTLQSKELIQKEEDEFYRLALDDHWEKRFEVLNERQKTVVFLAAEDYSYKEISNILGIPIGTVMSTLSRALQKLKENNVSE